MNIQKDTNGQEITETVRTIESDLETIKVGMTGIDERTTEMDEKLDYLLKGLLKEGMAGDDS